jgi:hypothetical protein
MSNLEDLLETPSVQDPRATFLAEYRLSGQDEIITLDVRSATPAQVAEWFDTMDLWEILLEFLNMRKAYNDLIRNMSTTPTTGVIINAAMLKDFTIFSGTNLKAFAIEKALPYKLHQY